MKTHILNYFWLAANKDGWLDIVWLTLEVGFNVLIYSSIMGGEF